MVRTAVIVALAAATATAAPFVARDQRRFEHDRHATAVAKAGGSVAACTTCHDATPAGEPMQHGKAEHERCFGACHDHTFGVTCGTLSVGGASGPSKQVCLVCHATLLSTCNPPGIVAQAAAPSFTARFIHTAPGHGTAAIERDCVLCHRAQKAAAATIGTGHAECGACHAGAARPAMTDCAGCHVAPIAHPAAAFDPFRLTGFDHAAHAATARDGACLACHTKASGESLRPTMAGCQAQCHNGARAFTTTGTSCTKCHRAIDPPTPARADLGFSHAGHEHRNVRIADCASCHALEADATVAPPLHGKSHLPCAASGCHETEFMSRAPRICGICHETASPWTKPLVRPGGPPGHEWFQDFDHASHLRTAGPANATCDGCHGAVLTGGTAPRGHRECASCHGASQRPAMTDCVACHARTAPARAAPSTWSVAKRFQHVTHAVDPRTGHATACVECHAEVGTAKNLAAIAAPKMPRCDGCHDGKLAFKSTGFDCARCHAPGGGK